MKAALKKLSALNRYTVLRNLVFSFSCPVFCFCIVCFDQQPGLNIGRIE